MADKNVGTLPQAEGIYDDALFVVEHSGEAKQVSGKQIKDFAKQGVEAFVGDAQKAAEEAMEAVATIGSAVEDTKANKEAAQSAQAAAETAEDGAAAARTAIENMLVEAVALSTGEPAAVSKELVDGVVKLVFGLPAGPQGVKGDTGSSISKIERTSGTGTPGTTDTYTITMSDGGAYTFQVYNGADGIGAGDFMASGAEPMMGDIQMSGNRVTGLGAPIDDGDAVRKVDLKDLTVTTDAVPTRGSTNPVQSGGVLDALAKKQDTISGSVGQIVGFDVDGKAVAQDAPETGVVTFNGRTGAVTPQAGDYTAAQVGARPSTWTPTAAQVGALPVQSGKSGQLLGFTADNVVGAVNAPATGVTSFKGRTGAVQPASGDYTAAQVGARPSNWMPTAADVGALPITGGTLAGNLTLKGSQNFGTKINFGDGDYVHLYEISDDTLEIKATRLNIVTNSDADATLNGKPLATAGGGGEVEYSNDVTVADDRGMFTHLDVFKCEYVKCGKNVILDLAFEFRLQTDGASPYVNIYNAPYLYRISGIDFVTYVEDGNSSSYDKLAIAKFYSSPYQGWSSFQLNEILGYDNQSGKSTFIPGRLYRVSVIIPYICE